MMNQNSVELPMTIKELLIEIHKLTVQLSDLDFGEERKAREHSVAFSPGTMVAPSARPKQFTHEFFKYLVNVHAPQHHFHLETLFATGALTNENLYTALKNKIEKLYGIINGFRQSD